MAEAKRKSSSKQVLDIHKPGKVTTSDTAKPVIVSNRQILRDPMVTEEATTPVTETKLTPTAPDLTKAEAKPEAAVPKVVAEAPQAVEESPKDAEAVPAAVEPEAPAEVAPAEPADEVAAPDSALVAASETEEAVPAAEKKRFEPSAELVKEAAETKQDDPTESDVNTDDTILSDEAVEAAADEEAAKEEAALQKVIESRKYFLPINTLEKRRAERFIALGVLFGLILAVAWADIALDAGLIHIDGINAVTHFFSN